MFFGSIVLINVYNTRHKCTCHCLEMKLFFSPLKTRVDAAEDL